MNFRLLAVSVLIGLVLTVALYLFAPHTPERQRTDAEQQAAAKAFLRHPGAMEEWLKQCLPELMPQLLDAGYEGALLSTRTAQVEDVCRRTLNMLADGRLTMSEINRNRDPIPFKLVEDAERRPQPVAR